MCYCNRRLIEPITNQPYSQILFDPFEKTKSLLGSKNIQSISVSLTDNKNNELDLNGVPYTITLKLEIIDNTTHDLNFTNYATDARFTNTPVEKTNLEYIMENPQIISGAMENHYPRNF